MGVKNINLKQIFRPWKKKMDFQLAFGTNVSQIIVLASGKSFVLFFYVPLADA